MSNTHTATVTTLVAEVRVLMVGARQVTKSMARQLDIVSIDEIEPFGRVRIDRVVGAGTKFIGRHIATGVLVLSGMWEKRGDKFDLGEGIGAVLASDLRRSRHSYLVEDDDRYEQLRNLPLIVLGGM